MTKFRKGDQVTMISQWNDRGTVQVRDFTVYSCGAKRMILVDDAGVRFSGSELMPSGDGGVYLQIRPRMTRDEADAFGLDFAQNFLAHERERIERLIKGYGYPEGHSYTKGMRRQLADLHEPRVIHQGDPRV